MASKLAVYDTGYEDERFQQIVSQSFHCIICTNVIKDAVMCPQNEHLFCRTCITRYLMNSQKCPTCMEPLTVETLSQAPRGVKNLLSELKIRCEFSDRGCGKFIELGDLERHVADCGFAPAVCSNEGCELEVNKQDLLHHETAVCELRRVKCHSCNDIRIELDIVKVNLALMNEKMDRNEKKLSETLEKIEANQKAVENVVLNVELIRQQLNKEENNDEKEIHETLKELTKQLQKMIKQTSPDNVRSDEAISQEINRADNKRSKEIFSDDEVISNKNSQEIYSYGELSCNKVSVPQETANIGKQLSCDEVSVPQETANIGKQLSCNKVSVPQETANIGKQLSCDEVSVPQETANIGKQLSCDEVSVPQEIREYSKTSCDEVCDEICNEICNYGGRPSRDEVSVPQEIREHSKTSCADEDSVPQEIRNQGETSCDEVLQTTAISSTSRCYGEVSIKNPREIRACRTYSQENSYGDVTLVRCTPWERTSNSNLTKPYIGTMVEGRQTKNKSKKLNRKPR